MPISEKTVAEQYALTSSQYTFYSSVKGYPFYFKSKCPFLSFLLGYQQ